jgi:hypothetical protein
MVSRKLVLEDRRVYPKETTCRNKSDYQEDEGQLYLRRSRR